MIYDCHQVFNRKGRSKCTSQALGTTIGKRYANLIMVNYFKNGSKSCAESYKTKDTSDSTVIVASTTTIKLAPR